MQHKENLKYYEDKHTINAREQKAQSEEIIKELEAALRKLNEKTLF